MKKYHIRVLISILLIILFAAASTLLIIAKNNGFIHQRNTQTVYLTVNSIINQNQQTFSVSDEKIKLDSYQSNSDEKIGVLITTNNVDETAKLLESKGATTHKHKVGHVVAASISQNQIDSLADEDSIEQVLPNRVVQAFEINEVSETGAENFWNNEITGKGVIIAILDSGVNSEKVIAAEEFVGSGTTQDESGHGTKVAEIILSMAPDVKIINAKVLDKDNLGSEASVIAGINYAVEQDADIISLSLGGLFEDINSPLVAAVEDAISKGVTVVTASGNCGICGSCNGFVGVATPGISPNAITVGSVSGENSVCFSSGKNFGNYIKPDVVAPMTNSLTGTSASTPFVSGAAALLIQKYDAKPMQIKSLIENNAKDLGDSGKDTVFGSGKLNLNFLTEETLEETEQPIEFEQEKPREASNEKNVQGFSSDESWPQLRFNSQNTGTSSNTGAENGLEKYAVLDINGSVLFNPSSPIVANGNVYVAGLNKLYQLDASNISRIINSYDISLASTPTFANGYIYISGDYSYIYQLDASNISKKISSHYITGSTDYSPVVANGYVYTQAEFLNTDNNIYQFDASNVSKLINKKFITSNTGTVTKDCSIAATNNFVYSAIRDGNTYQLDASNVSKIIKSIATGLNEDANSPAVANGYVYVISGIRIYQLSESDISQMISSFDISALASSSPALANGYLYFTTYNTNEIKVIQLNASKISQVISSYTTIGSNGNITAIASSPVVINNQVYVGTYDGRIIQLNAFNVSQEISSYDAGSESTSSPAVANGYVYVVIGGKLYQFRDRGSIQLSVPGQEIAKDGTKSINLTTYTTSTKPITYSVVDENSAQVDCNIAGNNLLTITGKNGFTGIGICNIKAETTENSVISEVLIYVGVVPTTLDLSIESKDITFDNSGDPLITIHSVAGGSSIDFDVSLLEVSGANIVKKQTESISSFDTGKETNTINPSFTITRGNKLEVVIDSGNQINENSKMNNKASNIYKKSDVYLNFTIESNFVAPIKNYLEGELKGYNIINSASAADKIINIAYNAGTKTKGCNLGTVYYNGNSLSNPHVGLIFASGKTINVCGARIEGLVNAIRMMDKYEISNNKEVFFAKDNNAAIATLDFMKSQGTTTPDVVSRALYGGLMQNEKIVKTNDGTYLRLKNYKPILSQSFLDYLFNLDNSKPWLEPVIMAGGLWSDITAWDEAGKEIAMGIEDGKFSDSVEYTPRDVWLIELTGGPGTECDSCLDYTYDDVVNKYWPALVGGVLKLTGKNDAAYVGHSNGGRVALDAISNYNSIKSTTSYLSDGTPYTLPSTNPIDTFIGVGVPGAFSSPTLFTKDIDEGKGDNVIANFVKENKQHIRLAEVGSTLSTFSGKVVKLITLFDEQKISTNLLKAYIAFANNTADSQPGDDVNLQKSTLIYGTFSDYGTSDGVVPAADAIAINAKITSSDKQIIETNTIHVSQRENKGIKSIIKTRLNE